MSDKPPISAFVKDLYRIWITERPNQLAAALAYFGMFSFAPAIFIAFAVSGIFLDQLALRVRIFEQLEASFGPELIEFIQTTLKGVEPPDEAGSVLLSVVSFVALLLAASAFFFQLQFSLNTIWKVPPPETGATRVLIRQRLFSFLMVFAVGLTLVMLALVNVLWGWLESLPGLTIFDKSWSLPAFVLFLTLSFALLYKVLPDKKIAWRDVFIGAATGASLTTLGGAVVIWLLGLGRINSALEAAGSLVIILIGIYYGAQIFLFGAVIAREYARQYGSHRLTEKNKVDP